MSATDTPPETAAVVGGGVVGLAAAKRLADRGVSVTLYERQRVGTGATGQAAGLCYDAYVDRTDADLAARSLNWYRDVGALRACPYVWVARDDDHVAAAIREQVDRMRDRGRDVSLCHREELRERFPALRAEQFAVGAVARNAGYVDGRSCARVMADRASERGVDIRTGTPVELADETVVETPDGTRTFDAVLVAAGAHTDRIVASAGHTLALGRYRAQALVTDATDVTPPLFYDASERFYCRPAGGGLLVGNGAHAYRGDAEAVDRTADASFVDSALARVETAVDAAPSVTRSWAGLCTATPDREPLCGHCGGGLYVATGWHGHGVMRGPALGETIAAEMLGGVGIDHFDPTRFDGDEEITFPTGVD